MKTFKEWATNFDVRYFFMSFMITGLVGTAGCAHAQGSISVGGEVAFDINELADNTSACQDLNAFVNSKWIASNPIPDDHASWGSFDVLVDENLVTQRKIATEASAAADGAMAGSLEQKVGWLYQAGMDQESINKAGGDPIKPALKAIAALKSRAEIVEYIAAGFARGQQQVFSFSAGTDGKGESKQVGIASQAGLSLPISYYTGDAHTDILEAFAAYVEKTLILAGFAEEAAKSQASDVLSLETKLAKASLSPAELRIPGNSYNLISVDDAKKITPHFNWDMFFTEQKLSVDAFSLSQPRFFAEFERLLSEATVTQWQAYLRFHLIDDASPYLSAAYEDNHFQFYGKFLSGQPAQGDRWARVLAVVNRSMGEALGKMYVASELSPKAKKRAEALAHNILEALRHRIETTDWMTDDTKLKAIEKWKLIVVNVGYPDRWRDWSGLEIRRGTYYYNVLAAARFNHAYEVARIGKPADREEWNMPPQQVNAYYSRSTNTVYLPAAILRPPFFYADGDDAINYGGVGTLIGHEAIHGFDDKGRLIDGRGRRDNWWAAQDEAQFRARAAKLVAQFDGYSPIREKPDLHVNGRLTLGENIADLGGLNVAYDALQVALQNSHGEAPAKIDGYTQNQRFFLSYARVWRNSTRQKSAEILLNSDRHAPTSLRAIGAPSNSPAFAAAFQCMPSDPMVRSAENQVKIW
ncbi:M13 family metallopeptidase [Xanthomonas nasturtii]|uniref:M13 family metallopeptidase n=1 Tax=Xanthomonas nasturtii TaxID=1843581 RepID=UPI002B23DAD6|nr:M13 family metallopeptidase [Xanthomonas nasturtii]MEA9580411.1 M13 family metallopeptidase [Xanthomonas nasturtii]